jgi:hypothetical protein
VAVPVRTLDFVAVPVRTRKRATKVAVLEEEVAVLDEEVAVLDEEIACILICPRLVAVTRFAATLGGG